MIKIYNSLTNKLEEFKTIKENEISMYVCGPTVYNRLHIGNSRPVIFFDTISRFFKYLGYKVTYVSNFTDIDDKIIKKAKEENVTESEIAERYIKFILQLYKDLNCLPHDLNPRVTENMPEIIDFIKKMVDNGGAYVEGNDVYFDVSKIEKYGVLSGQSIDKLLTDVRIENSDNKHNSVDFTLWKKTEDGIKWDSPWGAGRPGWHTECVVMINKIFNNNMIDIHGGGSDLKFPHHDNEIAQSICVNNNMIANYWIHNGRVDLAGEKMSKSLGNVVWADELLKKMGHQSYRLMMFMVPYRQQIQYQESLELQAYKEYDKIKKPYISAIRKLELNNMDVPTCDYYKEDFGDNINKTIDDFVNAMSNDFNTANAITAIFNLTKLINGSLREKELDYNMLENEVKALKTMLWVLGINIDVKPLTAEEKELVLNWNKAKQDKDFEKADALRNEITLRKIEL